MPATHDAFEAVLLAEVVPALGCTEPIAIALAAARAREVLGRLPERATLRASGNIVKNVKAVVVPGSGGRKGLQIAVAMGLVAGDADAGLECLAGATHEQAEAAAALAAHVTVELAQGVEGLYLEVHAHAGDDVAAVTLKGTHSHIHEVRRNGTVLVAPAPDPVAAASADDELWTLENILGFARTVDLDARPALRERLLAQADANRAIAAEGLRGRWGAQVGRTLQLIRTDDVVTRARATAAAGSDARMSGCSMPVYINAGSGNQGMTVSLPVLEFARDLGSDEDTLLRALITANLLALHQKRLIGRMSAFCGVVSAAAGAAAGIAYLKGLDDEAVGAAVVNTLATSGGMVCDGAKPSCASKISLTVENACCGVDLAERGITFSPGDGIVGATVEDTIRNVGRVAKDGMAQTDVEILTVMLEGSAGRG